MTFLEALILGLIQGLTEFLPVSSSGHLELGNHLLNIGDSENLSFTIVVHAATVLSTIVVFRNDFQNLVKGGLQFKWNSETRYISMLLVSAVPVAIVGLFFRDKVESVFTENLTLIGICLIVTATLLSFAHFKKSAKNSQIGFKHSFIIGIAQMVAVLPGISRSGATIATGLLLGNERKEVARFSFLMVLIPILGAVFIDLIKGDWNDEMKIGLLPIVTGFVAAFLSGLAACRIMIKLVSRGNLIYFAIYCLIVGLIAIFAA